MGASLDNRSILHHQNLVCTEDCRQPAGDDDALLLATGEAIAAFPDQRVQRIGQRLNEVDDLGIAQAPRICSSVAPGRA